MERRPRALATANFDPLRQRKGKKYGCDGFRIFSRAHIGRRNEFFKFKKMHPLPGRRAPDLAKQGNARRMSAALRATSQTSRTKGLHHRFLRANALQHGIRTNALGQLVTPYHSRSVTMTAAPNSRANFCRAACRLIAIIRSAPIC